MVVILFSRAGYKLVLSERETAGPFWAATKKSSHALPPPSPSLKRVDSQIFGSDGVECGRSHCRREKNFRPDGANGTGKKHLDEMRGGCGNPTNGSVFFAGATARPHSGGTARAGMSLKFQITSGLPALTSTTMFGWRCRRRVLVQPLFSRTRGVLHDRVMPCSSNFRWQIMRMIPAAALSPTDKKQGSRLPWRWSRTKSA